MMMMMMIHCHKILSHAKLEVQSRNLAPSSLEPSLQMRLWKASSITP